MSNELRGTELLCAVVNHILDKPQCWHQQSWHCGTSHCVGGWAQVMGGKPADYAKCPSEPRELLGLDDAESAWLFDSRRVFSEIHGFASAKLAGVDYFNLSRFDLSGFNRAGFDRDGFDRAGFDRAGARLPRLVYVKLEAKP